jgi:hypothetical protein
MEEQKTMSWMKWSSIGAIGINFVALELIATRYPASEKPILAASIIVACLFGVSLGYMKHGQQYFSALRDFWNSPKRWVMFGFFLNFLSLLISRDIDIKDPREYAVRTLTTFAILALLVADEQSDTQRVKKTDVTK